MVTTVLEPTGAASTTPPGAYPVNDSKDAISDR